MVSSFCATFDRYSNYHRLTFFFISQTYFLRLQLKIFPVLYSLKRQLQALRKTVNYLSTVEQTELCFLMQIVDAESINIALVSL